MRNNITTALNWVLMLLAIIFICNEITSAAKSQKTVKTLYLDDKTITDVSVSQEGTILTFPVKPTKVILGKKDSFSIEYVENDLAIAPTSLSSTSNLFIYMLGRRYAFSLSTGPGLNDEIVIVRDASDENTRKVVKSE